MGGLERVEGQGERRGLGGGVRPRRVGMVPEGGERLTPDDECEVGAARGHVGGDVGHQA